MPTTVVNRKRERYDIYIGRPTIWGNPYSHDPSSKQAKFKVGTRKEAVQKYEEWIRSKPDLMKLAKQELKGKILGCWCKPDLCHGDILAKIAEED